MRGPNSKATACLLALLLGVAASCTGNSLDDGDSADVILEVVTMDSPPVTAQRAQSVNTCSISNQPCDTDVDCGQSGGSCVLAPTVCTLEVEEWQVTLRNQPKNTLATGPFNDLILISVDITYVWEDVVTTTAPLSVGLGGVVVPAQGEAQVTFFPISTFQVNSNPGIEGNTANLTMVFNARTVEGTAVRLTVLRQLPVEVCT